MRPAKQLRQLTVALFGEVLPTRTDALIKGAAAVVNVGRRDQHSRGDEMTGKLVGKNRRRICGNQLANESNLLSASPKRIVDASTEILHPKYGKVGEKSIAETRSLQKGRGDGRTDLTMK